MARTSVNYAHNLQLSSSSVEVIADVQAGKTSNPAKLSFLNTASVSRLVTVHVVETSGTAVTANKLVDKSIPAGKTWNVIEILGETFTAGMSLQATQDAGTDVNVNCSGQDES